MKHFHKIAANIDVVPLMQSIVRQPELWDQNTLRTRHPGTAHSEVSDILLWFNRLDQDPAAVADDRDVIDYPAWNLLPQARVLIFDLIRRVEGVRLGRVMITKLPAGKTITPHVDGGAPATFYSRFQIALQSLPGAVFRIGDEAVAFQTGDAWWIDNRTVHSVENHSSDDRIMLIADIRLA